MNFKLTASFKRKSKKLIKKDPGLRKIFAKQFRLFNSNPEHPSLKLHKLKGKRSEQYAMWLKGDLRAISIRNKKRVYLFFDLISHDEYRS